MRAIISDLGEKSMHLYGAEDAVIYADGRYAPCQGCFRCWTKHPARCAMKDSLHDVSSRIGGADEMVIITQNCYGSYSAQVKNVLDRAIGRSTPLSTWRGGQMHHTLRYGRHDLYRVIVWGEATENEKATMRLLAERNAINYGYARSEVAFVDRPEQVGEVLG